MRRRIFDDFGNNYSVNFDGVNDFVVAGSTSSFNYYHGATNTSAFSFSIGFWVKFDNPNLNGIQFIFSSANLTANVGLELFLDSRTSLSRSRTLQFLIRKGSGLNVVSQITPNNAYPNTTGWVHLLLTYDQSLASNNYNLYVDNVLTFTGSKTGETPSTANASNALRFGARADATLPMAGNLFNMFFAQGVITAGERAALIANPKASPQAIISSAFISNAYRFPQGAGNFPTWVDAYGGASGTMTNQLSSNIQLDTP